MINFLKRNITEFKSFNKDQLKNKFSGSFAHYCYYLFFPFLSLAFFIILLINRFHSIYFSSSDNGRIAGTLNLYWHMADLGDQPPKNRTHIIFFIPSTGKPANDQWDRMFKDEFIYFSSPLFFHYTQRLIRFYGVGKNLIYKLPGNIFYNSNIINNILKQKGPVVSLTQKEIEYGEQLLEEHGIKKEQKVFCFHNRDAAYLDKANPYSNWRYHDYRDSSISNYIKTAEYFSEKGFLGLRVGSVTREKLNPENKKVIDYANSGWRSDFLDVYLAYRCDFFLCSDTGISFPPEVFHKPMIYVNWSLVPRMTNWVHFAVFIPKKIFSKKLGRLLTFDEMHANPDFISPHKNVKWEEFDLIENTPDEILKVSQEMEKRMNGVWSEDPESIELQNQFWAKYPKDYIRPPKLYIGADYLLQNRDLLK